MAAYVVHKAGDHMIGGVTNAGTRSLQALEILPTGFVRVRSAQAPAQTYEAI